MRWSGASMRRSGWCETQADVWVGVMRFQGWCRTGWCMRLKAIETRAAGRDSREGLRSRHDGSLARRDAEAGVGCGPARVGQHSRQQWRNDREPSHPYRSWWVSSPDRSQGQDPAAHRVPDCGQGPRLSPARGSGPMRGSPPYAIAGRATVRRQRRSDGNRAMCRPDPSRGQPRRSDGPPPPSLHGPSHGPP
jgi:hypothetical protein